MAVDTQLELDVVVPSSGSGLGSKADVTGCTFEVLFAGVVSGVAHGEIFGLAKERALRLVAVWDAGSDVDQVSLAGFALAFRFGRLAVLPELPRLESCHPCWAKAGWGEREMRPELSQFWAGPSGGPRVEAQGAGSLGCADLRAN